MCLIEIIDIALKEMNIKKFLLFVISKINVCIIFGKLYCFIIGHIYTTQKICDL